MNTSQTYCLSRCRTTLVKKSSGARLRRTDASLRDAYLAARFNRLRQNIPAPYRTFVASNKIANGWQDRLLV